MANNLWSLDLELKALKTILTPKSEWGGKLFSSCKKDFFHHKISKAIYKRLLQICDSGQTDMPSYDFLLRDVKIPEDVRETALEALRDIPTVEDQGDFDYLVSGLAKLSKTRKLYTQAADVANQISDDKKDDIDLKSLADQLGETVMSVDAVDDFIAHLQIGAGYNQAAEDAYQDIVGGMFAENLIKSGIQEFDQRTGGYGRTNLVVWGSTSGGGKCLHPDSIVPTSKGLLTVKQLFDRNCGSVTSGWVTPREEILVATRAGLKSIDGVFKRSGQNLLTVTTALGDEVTGLSDHKLLAYDARVGDVMFKRLDQLTARDYIVKSTGEQLFSETQRIDYVQPKYTAAVTPNDVISFPRELSVNLATVFGLFIAESDAQLRFHNHDQSLHKFIASVFKDEFGYDTRHVFTGRSSTYTDVRVTLFDFLTQFLPPVKSAEKRVPQIIMQASAEHQRAFLRGYFEGDGTVYKKVEGRGSKFKNRWQVECTTISKGLAYQIKAMLENMGILCHVKRRPTWATNGSVKQVSKTSYTLSILRPSVLAFAERIGFLGGSKQRELQSYVEHLSKSYANANPNYMSRGVENQLPFSDLARRYILRASTIASKTVYTSTNKFVGTRTLGTWAVFNKGASASNFKNFLNNSKPFISRLLYGQLVTRHKQDNVPLEVQQNIETDSELLSLRERMATLAQYTWVAVKSVEVAPDSDVYDLSVPGPHEYSVNGVMSHNSMLAVNLLVRQYRLGYNVCLVTYEMSERELLVRLLACISEVDLNKIITGKINPQERERIDSSWREFVLIGALKGNSYSILNPKGGSSSIAEIAFRVKSMKLDSLILDYINFLTTSGKEEAQWQALGNVAKASKVLAARLNCVVHLLAQINETYDLRYSKGIRDHADFVFGWVRDEQAVQERIVTIRQIKARNAGPYDFSLKERFDICQFRDPDQEDRRVWPTQEEYFETLDRLSKLKLLLTKTTVEASNPEKRSVEVVKESEEPPEPSPVVVEPPPAPPPRKSTLLWSAKDVAPVDISELDIAAVKAIRNAGKTYEDSL